MHKIIVAIKMAPEDTEKYAYFMKEILPTLMEPGYTLLDELNVHIKYFKVVDILTYYPPSDQTIDKEPRLNKGLKKMKTRNRLMEGPSERAKARKRDKKDQKIVSVMEKVPMTFYTCNANHITNKMPILAHDVAKHKFDVIHITEAGLKEQVPTGMTGYKAVEHQRREQNRG